jgi:hypothetical protein
MGQTNPKYPVMEIALSTVSYPDLESGHERKLAGDIVGIRKSNIGAGLRELKRYLWLKVEGLEENEWALIGKSIKGFDKRRFCIPLQRLVQFNASFDMEKAQDVNIIYQPFLPVDEETGLWLYQPRPMNIMGLVYDKVTGIYL